MVQGGSLEAVSLTYPEREYFAHWRRFFDNMGGRTGKEGSLSRMAARIGAQEARTTVTHGLNEFEKAAARKSILLQLQQYQHDSRNTQDNHRQSPVPFEGQANRQSRATMCRNVEIGVYFYENTRGNPSSKARLPQIGAMKCRSPLSVKTLPA